MSYATAELHESILARTDRVRTSALPSDVLRIATSDERIVSVTAYEDGWVPNAYRYRAPGNATTYYRRPNGWWAVTRGTYDRKRSRGQGPSVVGFSARGGRLASS